MKQPSINAFHCPLSVAFLFHHSPRLCQSTAGCSPLSMFSIVLCLLLSCFTFHLGFVNPLQDVALCQCFPLSSVCCFPVPGGSLATMSSCHRLSDLFPLLGCHSVLRLVHLLPFILAVCPAHLHLCLSVYSTMSHSPTPTPSPTPCPISEHGIPSRSPRLKIFLSIVR